jgi:hypothetical protein
MAEIERLPNSVTVQYSELMQNCIHPVSDGSNISFKAKTVNGKRYWYLYISLGSSRREHYLGEESVTLLDRIADEREAWESDADDRALRARLVSMLVAGGMAATPRDEGKLLALLERSGVFLAGGALVGTVAFRAYANMLGVKWPSAPATQDIDIAADNTLRLALPREKKPVRLGQVILDSGMGFFEVPALDRKQPSTSYKIRGREFSVDVLAPMRGRETARPVQLDNFGTYAQPVRFLDYLLQDLQPAVLLFQHGIMVNVPSPARFAIHKCVVSQMRTAAFAAKGAKDLDQAEYLFQVLLTERPGDIVLAFEAVEKMGARFLQRFRAGLDRLGGETQQAIRTVIGLGA